MIGSVLLWLRRGTAGRLAIGLLAMEIVLQFSRSGWWHEWEWGLSLATGGLTFVGPLVAGMVAYDRGYRADPAITTVAAAARRGPAALLAIGLAGGLVTAGVWLVGMAVSIAVSARDASGFPHLWMIPEGLALIVLCLSTGLVVGRFLHSVLAGPLTAVAMYALPIVLPTVVPLRWVGLLQFMPSGGTLTAITRTPIHAMVTIACHLTLSALLLVIALVEPTTVWGRGLPRIALIGTTSLAVAGSLIGLDAVSRRVDPLQWAGGPNLCVHRAVTVCGSTTARYVINAAAISLSAATTKLRPSGINWQHNYLIPHAHHLPAGTAPLDINPEDLEHGRMGTFEVTTALTTPRECEAYHSETAAAPLQAKQEIVGAWIDRQLDSDQPVGTAPVKVKRAYHALRACKPRTWLP